MAAKTTKTLRMAFATDAGKTVTLSLADPRDDVTRAETAAFMTKLIDKNVLTHRKGRLSSIRNVKLRTVVESDLP